MHHMIGVDIGGTKCAVTLGCYSDGDISFPVKEQVDTRGSCGEVLDALDGIVRGILASCAKQGQTVTGVGISCGGPLDSRNGIILSPPNLPGWDNVMITDHYKDVFGLPAWLCNDADAGAVAEWTFGAGRGLSVLIDMLNPEVIIIGSIFRRSRDLIWPHAEEVIKKEALSRSLSACRVEASALGEKLGDYAAVTLALYKYGALSRRREAV